MDDLAAVMKGQPDVILLPKVSKPDQVTELDEAVASFERDLGLAEGRTELLPNIESARGLVAISSIVAASAPVLSQPRTWPLISALSDARMD